MAIKLYEKGSEVGRCRAALPEMIALIFGGTSARWVSDVQFDGTCGSIHAGFGRRGATRWRRTHYSTYLQCL